MGNAPPEVANDAPEAAITPIGPGELSLRVARRGWRWVWPLAKRRPLLSAWLTFVILASGLPCLFYYGYLSGRTQVVWGIGGGGVSRVDMSPLRYVTPSRHAFAWDADGSQLLRFSFEWTFQGQPVNDPPFLVAVPVWAVLLAPTLAIAAPILIRDHKRRRREQRAARAGRIPCPSCGYDATGLAICPECGAAARPVTPE
ncbi:MAG: hypothetical protein ACIAS6_09970 [Phycisphaerales bacterium JB060]